MTNLIQIAPGAEPLTKTQREFNRLTALVQTLNRDLTALRQTADALQRRLAAEYEPPYRQYLRLRADLVKLLDRAHQNGDFNSQERKKLVALILDMAHDLVVRHGMTELADLYQNYRPKNADNEQISHPLATVDASDEPADIPVLNAENTDQPDEKTARSKSEKGQARAAKKMLAAQQATRSVRAVYLDLVKAFHPDREPNVAEQVKKTAIMQRVTAAYEANDLLALLTLQIDLLTHKAGYLDTAPDAQLRAYNRLLSEQVADLQAQHADLIRELTTLNGRPLPKTNLLLTVEMSLNQDIKSLKREVKALKQELLALTNETVLRRWIVMNSE